MKPCGNILAKLDKLKITIFETDQTKVKTDQTKVKY